MYVTDILKMCMKTFGAKQIIFDELPAYGTSEWLLTNVCQLQIFVKMPIDKGLS